jgi:hypothetical protein
MLQEVIMKEYVFSFDKPFLQTGFAPKLKKFLDFRSRGRTLGAKPFSVFSHRHALAFFKLPSYYNLLTITEKQFLCS